MARKWHRIILFRIVLALIGTGQAIAETDPAAKLASGFADLAGSKENALAIVRGMNTGKVITIRDEASSGGSQVLAFNMAEGPLAWSDVEATLSRVRTRFAKQGVTQPTMEQLQGALVPGVSERPAVASAGNPGLPRTVYAALDLPPSALPSAEASAWGRYVPRERSSNRIEKFPGIN